MFGSLTDEEIAANAGKTYQDMTALRDPLMGLELGEEEGPGPFDGAARDAAVMDHPGQPRDPHGRFAGGKMLTEGEGTGTLQSSRRVVLPDGSISQVSPGTKITKVVTFAGRGTNKTLRAANRLSKQHGGNPADWGKVRGDGFVDFQGAPRHCELHWYDSPQIGRVEMKVKRWFDES